MTTRNSFSTHTSEVFGLCTEKIELRSMERTTTTSKMNITQIVILGAVLVWDH